MFTVVSFIALGFIGKLCFDELGSVKSEVESYGLYQTNEILRAKYDSVIKLYTYKGQIPFQLHIRPADNTKGSCELFQNITGRIKFFDDDPQYKFNKTIHFNCELMDSVHNFQNLTIRESDQKFIHDHIDGIKGIDIRIDNTHNNLSKICSEHDWYYQIVYYNQQIYAWNFKLGGQSLFPNMQYLSPALTSLCLQTSLNWGTV